MFAGSQKSQKQNRLRSLVLTVASLDVALCLLLIATASFGSPPDRANHSDGRYGVFAIGQ